MQALRICLLAACVLVAPGCGDGAPEVLEATPSGPYRLTLAFDPAPPRPGIATQLTLSLSHSASGAPVSDLQIVHERALHTFIIARDFSSFAHVHQEDFGTLSEAQRRAAQFTFPYSFPRAGPYRIVSEFTHRDRGWMKQFDFDVGDYGDVPPAPRIDLTRVREVEEYTATLAVSPAQPVAGHETELVVALARHQVPVTNLALLLGAEVHVALWRIDGEHFGHTHSFTPRMAKMMREMAGHGGGHSAAMMLEMMSAPAELVYPGPRVPIRFTFPTPGTYQVFIQCAPGGKVVVFPFMVEAVPYRAGLPTTLDTIVPDA